MGAAQITRPLEAGDGRIKVLWLDDTIERIAPWGSARLDYEPWFSMVYATHPSDVSDLVRQSARVGGERSYSGLQYKAPGVPFDVYLLDFRMCDKVDDGCLLEEHLEAGLHAPSAGFLVGMLTALRWPNHAQAIIPSSGYAEEFGQIWRLAEQFCPPSVHVLWDDSVTKGRRSQESLMRLLPQQCRGALRVSMEAQAVCLPLKERDRWEALLQVNDDSSVRADEMIYLTGDYGVRPYLIGALFHDHLDEENLTVPVQPIRDWISELPVADSIETEARRLAEFYWKMRWTDISRSVYAVGRERRNGRKIPGLPEKPASYPWLCSKMRSDKSKRRNRLAILFLLLRDHDYRVKRRLHRDGLSDACKRLLKMITYDLESIEDLLEDLRTQAWAHGYAEMYNDLIAEFLEFVGDLPFIDPIREIFDDWDLDVSEADVVRLLDPLPPTWDVPISLDVAKKIGKGLTHLNIGDTPTLAVKALLAGDGSSMTPTELFCARRFARELQLAEVDWPEWLRGGE